MNQNNIQFDVHLNTISVLLERAKTTEDPAVYLFENDFRTPLFQLEALARIYSSTGPNKKKFDKMQEKFKLLEDTLGGIDYFDAYGKLFFNNEKIPGDVRSYFSRKEEKTVRKLNKILKSEGWLNGKQLERINNDLKKTGWKNKDEQHKRLLKFYRSEIEEIVDFAREGKVAFTDVESGIHELRRKLRWLSIYAQALQGCIKLVEIEQEKLALGNYLTGSVLNSPYNRLPPVEDKKLHPLLLSHYGFFALSWMIEQLGLLKDRGFGLLALAEAIMETKGIKNEKDAILQAKKYLGNKAPSIDDVLKEGNQITKQFFTDRILKNLLK